MNSGNLGQRLSPREAMELALAEARKGAGFVAPNPLVGCVIVDADHRLLASGYHAKVGTDHAEAAALRKIADTALLKGAHVYVTLEPCAHQGRTPSCARTLSQYPLGSVTFGIIDPNPKVAGQGQEILRSAGIRCEAMPEIADACEELAEIFLWNMREKRPFVALKTAASWDAQMALQSGESQWITGPEARLQGHYLRGCYDAIAVGASTVLADDPSLNVRHPAFPGKANTVVILDAEGRTWSSLERSRIRQSHAPESIIVVTKPGAVSRSMSNITVLECPRDITGALDLDAMLAVLFERGITSVYVEGGALTYSEFLRQRAAQRIYLFLAPAIIGAAGGLNWTARYRSEHLTEQIRLRGVKVENVGADLLLTGRLDVPPKSAGVSRPLRAEPGVV